MTAATYQHTSWIPKRTAPTSARGMVAAKMPQAAEVGAEILARGGNAIDAAVATAFAIGVVEPAMSGIGGGGYMVVWLARQQRAVVIDYAMRAPAAASEEMYPLDPAAEPGFFGWPSTIESRHALGPHSIAVPGTVAGLALALQEFGTLSLAEVLEPAIALAENGFPVTNHITTLIARDVKAIRTFPETARTFLDSQGDPLVSAEQAAPTIIRQPELANTLRLIAEQGPEAFYRGEIAAKIAEYMAAEGTVFASNDLADYTARIVEPNAVSYHGATVYSSPGCSGGTSLTQALTALNTLDLGAPVDFAPESWHRLAGVFRRAFADRYSYLADPEFVDVPIPSMLSDAYAQATIDAIGEHAMPPTPGSREELGVTHALGASVPEYMKDGSTTHLSVIDADGNAVSCTQTLLALFGSRVTIPGTGILMNNGMMWFDPEPTRPNSIAGGKSPLSNMAPVIVTRDGQALAAIGASGGRKIMNCNTQVLMNIIDGDRSAQDAIDAPRLDCSTRQVLVSTRFPSDALRDLQGRGYDVAIRHEGLLTGDFSSPVVVRRSPDGMLDGGADPWYFAATAVGVEK